MMIKHKHNNALFLFIHFFDLASEEEDDERAIPTNLFFDRFLTTYIRGYYRDRTERLHYCCIRGIHCSS